MLHKTCQQYRNLNVANIIPYDYSTQNYNKSIIIYNKGTK